MRISSFIISILLVGLIVVGFYELADDLAGEDAYDVTLNESYKDAFDKTANVSSEISDNYESIIGSSDKNETGWVVDKLSYLALIPNVVSLVVNMVQLPFTVTGEIIGNLTDYLNLPSWISVFLTTAFLVLLIFGIIAIVMRFKDV